MTEPWHLPGLEGPDRGPAEAPDRERAWHAGVTASGARYRTPRLGAEAAARVAAAVREAALRARRERSLRQVVDGVAAAAGRLADPEDPAGREAADLLRRELGWTASLARDTVAGMARSWSAEALWRVLETELDDPAVLEGWRPAPPRRVRRAAGPPLIFCVHAGNVPGVAVTAVLRGLLVRSGVLSRAAAAEPGLPALFARSLAEEDALLGRAVASTWWPAESPEGEAAWDAWLERAGRVVVYGGEAAVRGVRRRLPAGADLVAYGPRLGVAVVLADAARGAAADRAAAALARDVCAYEQRGCVSPRVVYVVGRVEPLAERLARHLAEEVARRPPPPLGDAEAVALRSLRSAWEFRGYAGEAGEEAPGGSEGPEPARRVWASRDDLAWTVLAGGPPEPAAEALPRVVRLHGVPDLAAVERALEPLEGRLQAVGLAGREHADRAAALAFRLGAARVAPLGRVAWPPADWRHDGRHQLLPLLRWTDWESEADPGRP